MWASSESWIAVFTLAFVCATAPATFADGSSPNAITTELVKQANAPISSMLQVRLQDSYSPVWQKVPGQGNAFGISVTAPFREFRLLPFPQLSLLKIPAILTFPTQPTGLGDVSFLDLPVFRFSHDFVCGVGPTFAFPTATVAALGQGKWQVGPAGAIAWAPRQWLIGVLAQNPISVGGDPNRPAVNQLLVQPFLSYAFGEGWFVRSEPQMVIDWRTHKQLLPVNLGFGRVFKIGGQDVSAFIEPGWTISYDGPAPHYFIGYNFVFLFPDFWKTRMNFFNR
jgi:hypothetical protein